MSYMSFFSTQAHEQNCELDEGTLARTGKEVWKLFQQPMAIDYKAHLSEITI